MNRNRQLYSIGLVVFSIPFACGNSTPSNDSAQPDRRVAADVAMSTPTKTPKPSPLPLEAPLRYFGNRDLKRVTEPLPFAAQEGGSVVLIVMDATNARHLSAYGYGRETSPNIDALAKQGLLLTNHVSNSSWTRPSFTTIITGLPKAEHQVELSGKKLEMEITTLAERFRTAGYRTAGFVGNPLVREVWGFGQGFQTYKDTISFDKAFPPDRVLADRAVDWLQRIGDEPFYLMVFFTSPHVPYRPPRPYRKFMEGLPKARLWEYPYQEYLKPLPKEEHDLLVAAYDGDVAYGDASVGRIIDYLKESGKMGRTTVAITADHGEVFGHHNCYVHAWHMWEPALRVPFVLASPGLKEKGVYDDRPYTHVDIAPTLLRAAGLEVPKDELKGISILDQLADPNEGRNRIRFSQYNAHGIRRQAIRDERYKLVHHHLVNDKDLERLHSLHPRIPSPDPKELPTLARDKERYELYDLIEDADERTDLFASKQHIEEVKRLRKALEPHIDEPPDDNTALSPETLQALKNAGYIR